MADAAGTRRGRTALPGSPARTLDPDTLNALAAFADRLADVAAAETLPYFRADSGAENKASGARYDPVTLADRAAETAIRETIREHHPDHGVLGEEFGFRPGDSGLTWVIDPIDGTKSFITGLHHWATLIALFDGEKPRLGIADQPYVGERFFGDGERAELRRPGQPPRPLRVRACEALGQAILCATGRDIFDGEDELAAFDAVAARTRMVRYGGDCYIYCMLAAGLVDLVIESTLKAHDVQALIPIVEGAGGIISDWSGGSAVNGGRVVAAGDARIHREAMALLEAAG